MIKVRNKETGEYINNCYASNGILFQGRIRHDNILDKNKYEIINNNTEVIKQIEKRIKALDEADNYLKYPNAADNKASRIIEKTIKKQLEWVLDLLKESEQ